MKRQKNASEVGKGRVLSIASLASGMNGAGNGCFALAQERLVDQWRLYVMIT